MTVINRLDQIKTAIEAIQAGGFDGSLPGTETILANLRGDVQANTNALICVCNALNNMAFNDPTNHPIFPPITPPEQNDPVVNPPPIEGGWTLCKAAYAYIENLANKADNWAAFSATPYWNLAGLIASILGSVGVLFFPGALFSTALNATGISIGIWGALSAIAEHNAEEVFTEISSQLRTNAQLRSCMVAAFTTGSPTAIHDAINNRYGSPYGDTVLKLMIVKAGIDNYTNGYEENGILVWPQGDDSDGCDCLGNLLINDNFEIDTINNQLWTSSRFTIADGWAIGNARTGDLALLSLSEQNIINLGLQHGVYTNVLITFTYRKTEDNGGTRSFVLRLKDTNNSAFNAFSADVPNMNINESYAASVSVVQDINFNTLAGATPLLFRVETNSSRLIIEIDDFIMRGDLVI